jgi:hypothetical protein
MAGQGAPPQEAKVAMVICKDPLCMRFFAVPLRPNLWGNGKLRLTCTECKHENECQAKDFHEADGRSGTAVNPV